MSASNELGLIGPLVKKVDSNFARADLLPVFNKGSSIKAAAGKEDNIVLINLGTDTDFNFF
jgi:hypothetical protein